MIAQIAPTEMPMEAVQEIPPPEISSPRPSRAALWVVLIGVASVVLVVSWLTDPKKPAFDWAMQTAPPGSVNLDTLVAAGDGFAMLSGMTERGVLLWSIGPDSTWATRSLPGTPTQLAGLGDSLLTYGIEAGTVLRRSEAGWAETRDIRFPSEVLSRQESGQPGVIGSEERLLAMTLMGEIWGSFDQSDFTRVIDDAQWGAGGEAPFPPGSADRPFDDACRPPSRNSPDIVPLVATDIGFVALVSHNSEEVFGMRPVCEPRVWLSVTGEEWGATGSILGQGAYVYDLAWRDGTFIAVGGFGIGESTAWTSNNGTDWIEIPVLPDADDIDLFTVEAGEAGWVILGSDERLHANVGWTSVDGKCWERIPTEVEPSDAAVSKHQIMVLERGPLPTWWIGSSTEETGICLG